MSEQNSLARAYSSDMADNDPLAELARIVAGETPPPPPLRRSVVTPTLPKAPPPVRQSMPEAKLPEPRPAAIPPVRTIVAPPPVDLEDALLAELGLAEPAARPVPTAPVAAKPAARVPAPVKPAPQKPASLEDQLMAELGLGDAGAQDNRAAGIDSPALDLDEIERALAFEPAPAQTSVRPAVPAARAIPAPAPKAAPVARTVPAPVAMPDPDEFEAILNADIEEQPDAARRPGRPLPLSYEADVLDEGLAAAIQATQPAADPIKAFDFGSAFEAEVKHLEVAIPPAPPPPPVISVQRPRTTPVRAAVPPAPPPAFELPAFIEPEPQPAPRVMTERDLDEHFASAFAEELELGLAPHEGAGSESDAPSMIIDESAFEAALDLESGLSPELEDAQTVKQAYRARAERIEDDPSFDPVLGQTDFDPAPDWGRDPGPAPQPTTASGAAGVRLPTQARGFRLAAIALGAALLVGTLAVTYGYMSGGGTDGGEPVVVRADDGPVKVKPENPGGTEIANQDQAAYDKVSGDAPQAPAQEKLVTASEQPVEIARAVEEPAATAEPAPVTGETTQAVPADGKTEQRLVPGTETAAAAPVPALAPRRVKTLSIKPDGTVVQPADAPAAAATQETAFAPVEQGSTLPGVEVGTAAVPQQPAAEETAPATRSLGTSQDAAAEQTAAVAADNAAAIGGEWAVQLASQRSAEEAQSTYQNLKRKFPSVLDGKPIAVQRAEVSGKGVFYRVRVPTQTKEEAVALCDELKAAGGSCFIAR